MSKYNKPWKSVDGKYDYKKIYDGMTLHDLTTFYCRKIFHTLLPEHINGKDNTSLTDIEDESLPFKFPLYNNGRNLLKRGTYLYDGVAHSIGNFYENFDPLHGDYEDAENLLESGWKENKKFWEETSPWEKNKSLGIPRDEDTSLEGEIVVKELVKFLPIERKMKKFSRQRYLLHQEYNYDPLYFMLDMYIVCAMFYMLSRTFFYGNCVC
jgi:hypothetical protein